MATHPDWTVRFAGVSLTLLPERAIWIAQERILLVSDLHLEKSSYYAQTGQFLPPYDSVETLQRLSFLVDRFSPRQVITLGDNFHDGGGRDRLSDAARAQLAHIEERARITWIEGNHDGYAGAISAYVGPILLTHEPMAASAAQIVGHFHPKLKIAGAGYRIVRPCFVMDDQLIIMPSFGALTGGLWVNSAAIRRAITPRARALVPHAKGLIQTTITGMRSS